MNLVLQPCSNKIAFKHYCYTILNDEINLQYIKPYLDSKDYKNLLNIYGGNSIQIWGIKKAACKKWNQLDIGDIVLFSRNKEIFSYGIVCYKIHNAQLANKLWSEDIDGSTWEFIYFLTEMANIKIPYANFNKIVGYKENNVIQGFTILDHNKSENFLNVYPLQSKTFIKAVDEVEYIETLNNPLFEMDMVDGKILSNHRKEQAFLRKNLFKDKMKARCSICGEEFPISLLCCAHIKKRCYCSLEEKKDYENIVIPMCDFGCDKLYENGYISVEDGYVKVLKLSGISYVDNKLKALEHRGVLGYNNKNKKYFDAHLAQNKWNSK